MSLHAYTELAPTSASLNHPSRFHGGVLRSGHNKAFKDSTQLSLALNLLSECANSKDTSVVIDGHNLSIADVVAVVRYGSNVCLTDSDLVKERVDLSVEQLQNRINSYEIIYGVTTGYGGSADTRTDEHVELQRSLLKLLSVGITSKMDHVTPEEIVRAAMLVRVNSNCRGHSAIRWEVLQMLIDMVEYRVIPQVPLRGSISASGDLIPFAYIASCMIGRPGICASVPDKDTNIMKVLPAKEALEYCGLEAISFQAKEALALINGTAFSTAAGALAIYDANMLGITVQVLTAMTVEALTGTCESYSEFIQSVRPHWGQIEVGKNISGILRESTLVSDNKDYAMNDNSLRQDRYALRTAPQWIGPQLEAISEATRVITIELNSTTDNPLFDYENNEVAHGGNFQAMAVTSAMESTRLALQHLAKLIFAQHTELVNFKTSNGLSPNLAFEEPSLDYGCKGVEISMASYMSEIGYLANPVSTHVQSAELNNQSVNSLAFISARYTLEAVKLMQMMSAAHLFALYQAINLRQIWINFTARFSTLLAETVGHHFGDFLAQETLAQLTQELSATVFNDLKNNGNMDSEPRFRTTMSSTRINFFKYLSSDTVTAISGAQAQFLEAITAWTNEISARSAALFRSCHTNYEDGSAADLLGTTRILYNYVHKVIGIPTWRHYGDLEIGNQITKIQAHFESGKIYKAIGDVLLAAQ